MNRILARQEFFLLLLCAVGMLIALLTPLDTGANWFFWGPLFDAGHYPLFFVATLLALRFMRFLPAALPDWIRIPYLPVALLVIGIELIQPLFKRSASLADTLNGLLGVAAAGIAHQFFLRNRSWASRLLLLAWLGALMIPLLWPLQGSLFAMQWRASKFPVLATFQAEPESLLWAGLEPETPTLRKYSRSRFVHDTLLKDRFGLLVETSTGYYAGITYSAGDLDWSPYDHLYLRLYNPTQTPFTLLLRIDDHSRESLKFDGRFNASYTLTPGSNEIRIPVEKIASGPKSRLLDTTRIRRILLFVDKTDSPRRYVVERLELRNPKTAAHSSQKSHIFEF